MPKTPDGRILVQLNGDPLADAGVLADALAESDADLFIADDRLVVLNDGVLVPVVDTNLSEMLNKHLATKRLVMNGNSKWTVTYVPVTIDQRMIRILLTGTDPRTREKIKGGGLADRVPKV
jgi:hypothetical protein